MRLRRAGLADAGRLSLVGGASFLESFANDHDGDQMVAFVQNDHSPDYYAKLLAKKGTQAWLVEEIAGAPVGYAVLIPATLPHSTPRDIELKRIYMLSKWHGGGWGGKLYAEIEAAARAQGAERLILSVYVKNFSAQRFYQSRGFKELGRWKFPGFEASATCDTSEDFIYAKHLTEGV